MRRKERSLLSPGTGCLWVLVDQCNSLDHEKRAKLSLFRLLKFPNQQFKCSGYVGAYRLYKQTQTLNWDFCRHLEQFSPALKPVPMVYHHNWMERLEATIGNDGFWWLCTNALVQRWNDKVPLPKSNVQHLYTREISPKKRENVGILRKKTGGGSTQIPLLL